MNSFPLAWRGIIGPCYVVQNLYIGTLLDIVQSLYTGILLDIVQSLTLIIKH